MQSLSRRGLYIPAPRSSSVRLGRHIPIVSLGKRVSRQGLVTPWHRDVTKAKKGEVNADFDEEEEEEDDEDGEDDEQFGFEYEEEEDIFEEDQDWEAPLREFSADDDEKAYKPRDMSSAFMPDRNAPSQTTVQELEYVEEPVVEVDKAAAYRGMAILTERESQELSENRQGYQSFAMDGLEFMVAETADGKLDLADSYIFDSVADIFARPDVVGDIPSGPCQYQTITWRRQVSGDFLKHKSAVRKMLKVVFLPVISTRPYEVDLEKVFVFDCKLRILGSVVVQKPEGEIVDPVLRIRADGVFLEDSGHIPDPQILVEEREGLRRLPDYDREEKMEELEGDVYQELDDLPDVPAVDLV